MAHLKRQVRKLQKASTSLASSSKTLQEVRSEKKLASIAAVRCCHLLLQEGLAILAKNRKHQSAIISERMGAISLHPEDIQSQYRSSSLLSPAASANNSNVHSLTYSLETNSSRPLDAAAAVSNNASDANLYCYDSTRTSEQLSMGNIFKSDRGSLRTTSFSMMRS